VGRDEDFECETLIAKACIKGDMIFVQIYEKIYLASLEECKNHFCMGQWKTMPLGKGLHI